MTTKVSKVVFSGFDVNVTYSKELKTWFGFLLDDDGNQIGDHKCAVSKDHVIFFLGMEYLQYKQSFNK
jgi:hypothetical protein